MIQGFLQVFVPIACKIASALLIWHNGSRTPRMTPRSSE